MKKKENWKSKLTATQMIELFGHPVQAKKCIDEILEELHIFNHKLTPLLSERIRFWEEVRRSI